MRLQRQEWDFYSRVVALLSALPMILPFLNKPTALKKREREKDEVHTSFCCFLSSGHLGSGL
uniref:Putative ovule protein n=1 Tax=Solanum chacoense TaxID=4108 RepID=A0A0V0IEH4_SOLCH